MLLLYSYYVFFCLRRWLEMIGPEEFKRGTVISSMIILCVCSVYSDEMKPIAAYTTTTNKLLSIPMQKELWWLLLLLLQLLNPSVHFDIKLQYPVYMSRSITADMICITHKHTFYFVFCYIDGVMDISGLTSWQEIVGIFIHWNDIKLLWLSILKNSYLLLYRLVDKQIQIYAESFL